MNYRILKIILIFILLFALLILLTIIFQLYRNPLTALPKNQDHSISTEEKSFFKDNRIIKQYIIHDSNLGNINLAASFPNPIPIKPLPVLIILGGLETGFNSLNHVSNIGDNILVGYNWPINPLHLESKNKIIHFPNIYSDIYKTPGQIAKTIKWVWEQQWSENKRITLLGFSLGAIAAPAVKNIIDNEGIVDVSWTVLAYGGANIGLLVNTNHNIKPNWTKPLLGWIIQILFNSIDPKEHLPYLSGNFLLIHGKNDQFIPKLSSLLMQKLTPSPKTNILLEGNHMGVGKDQKKLLNKIIMKTRVWLQKNGAINSNF